MEVWILTEPEFGFLTASDTGWPCTVAEPNGKSVGLATLTALPCNVIPTVRSLDETRRFEEPEPPTTDDPAETT